MTQIIKKCINCRYFDRFYIKGVKRYNSVNYGWRCKKVNVVETLESCGEYMLETRTYKSKRAIYAVLSDLLTGISAIRNILQDGKNENE